MIDYTAYLMAQQRTAALAREALPDAQACLMAEPTRRVRRQLLRQGMSLALRQLADRLEPPRVEGQSAVVGWR